MFNNAGVTGLIIGKYNSSGTIQWQRKLTTLSGIVCYIKSDTSGNTYTISVPSTGSGIVLVKYDTSGAIQWQRKVTGTGIGLASGTPAFDSSGNIYVMCTSTTLTNGWSIYKYNTSGTIQWQRKMSTTSGWTASIGTASLYIDSGDSISVSCQIGTDANAKFTILTAKLPSDGSKTGSYAVTINGTSVTWAYAVATYTEAIGGLTDAAGTATSSSPTQTSFSNPTITNYSSQATLTTSIVNT
jgi:hypothetical protein